MKNTTNMEGERFALQPDNGHEVDQQHNGPKALDVVYNSFNRIDDIGVKSAEEVAVIIFVGRARLSTPIVYDITGIPGDEVDDAVKAQVANLATGRDYRYELVSKVDNVYFYSANFSK